MLHFAKRDKRGSAAITFFSFARFRYDEITFLRNDFFWLSKKKKEKYNEEFAWDCKKPAMQMSLVRKAPHFPISEARSLAESSFEEKEVKVGS